MSIIKYYLLEYLPSKDVLSVASASGIFMNMFYPLVSLIAKNLTLFVWLKEINERVAFRQKSKQIFSWYQPEIMVGVSEPGRLSLSVKNISLLDSMLLIDSSVTYGYL